MARQEVVPTEYPRVEVAEAQVMVMDAEVMERRVLEAGMLEMARTDSVVCVVTLGGASSEILI